MRCSGCNWMRERERQSDNTVSRIRAKLAARVRVMSRGERAKLDRLLINIELLADAQGAAKHIGLSSKLLHKWMSTPEIRWVIDQALAEGERIVSGEEKTFVPLWWSPKTGESSRFRAKVASENLKAAKPEILQAAEDNDKAFFVDLGKCLSGELDPTIIDQREAYVASLLTRYPSITSKDAIDELARRGFPRITEENFRMLKKRLKKKVHTEPDHDEPRRALRALARQLNIAGA